MSEFGIAEFLRWHEQLRMQIAWLSAAHVTDDADPAVIAAGTGQRSGAFAAGPCRAGSPTPSCVADGRFHFQLTADLTDAVLSKPFRIEAVVAAVRSVLAQRVVPEGS